MVNGAVNSRTPTSYQIAALRLRTGCGLKDCKEALEVCECDFLLAEGYLKYRDCAIAVHPKDGETAAEAKRKWVMQKAFEWKTRSIKIPPSEPNP